MFLVTTIAITPEFIFNYVFGSEFEDVKYISLLIMPGVISLAISNLYGHYFAGVEKLNILRIKSIIGLIVTIILLFVLVPPFKLNGVIITFNASYMFSSYYLFLKFKKEEKNL
jgi:O-antigen/teichoic acid export membrane protein